jgi:hypothetical protein
MLLGHEFIFLIEGEDDLVAAKIHVFLLGKIGKANINVTRVFLNLICNHDIISPVTLKKIFQ